MTDKTHATDLHDVYDLLHVNSRTEHPAVVLVVLCKGSAAATQLRHAEINTYTNRQRHTDGHTKRLLLAAVVVSTRSETPRQYLLTPQQIF